MPETDFVTDVSSLDFNPPDEDAWTDYEDATLRRPTPPSGSYFLRMPETFGFKKGKEGQLVIMLEPLTIVGGPADGYGLRFTRVSTKKLPNTQATTASDVLRNFFGSFGSDGKLSYSGPQPKTAVEWQEAFRSIAGQVTPFPVYADWEAYDSTQGKTLKKGMKNFPKNEDGTHQDILQVTGSNGDATDTHPVYANLRVSTRGFSPMLKKD